MSVKSRLRMLLLCGPLVLGSLMGVSMRADEIEELMGLASQTKTVYVLPEEKALDE